MNADESRRSSVVCMALVLLVTGTDPARAATEIESGPGQMTLVELYTSQGCSSCPPADRWMSHLQTRSGLWTSYVPVAFHVDYWDYIGWRDPFAAAGFNDRQRRYAEEGGVSTVYTPAVLLNGQEWAQWRSSPEPELAPAHAGQLSAIIEGGMAVLRYAPGQAPDRELTVYAAVLGFGLVSEVRSGENAGRNLRNDFVVLHLGQTTMTRRGNVYDANLEVTGDPMDDVARYAVAVWISPAGSQAPLQAAGGWVAGGDLHKAAAVVPDGDHTRSGD